MVLTWSHAYSYIVGIHIGTAGWNIPRAHKKRFPPSGSQLERYAVRLNATEINSSFYRPHAFTTYERWSATVPATFQFAIKIPKLISHERLLTRAREPLSKLLNETAGLREKRGPFLLQLPPSFAFDSRRAGRFFQLFRRLHPGSIVCEPRHATWASDAATRLLEAFEIGCVAADPPRAAGFEQPAGWGGIAYFRWHGSPHAYFSPYSRASLQALAASVKARPSDVETWCIFDNTGSGAAAANALDLVNFTNGRSKK